MRANRGIGTVLLAFLACTALAVGLAACGGTDDATSGGANEVAEGEAVTVGGLRYDVSSRFLDPHDSTDAAYIGGQPAPSGGLHYAGVFVEVENDTDRPEDLATMSVTDARGVEHAAFPPGSSPYMRSFGEVVKPHETQPAGDSTGGPPVRSLLLFRLTPGSEKRPFTPHIGSEEEEAEVTLDL
jgi:hypothetical protein